MRSVILGAIVGTTGALFLVAGTVHSKSYVGTIVCNDRGCGKPLYFRDAPLWHEPRRYATRRHQSRQSRHARGRTYQRNYAARPALRIDEQRTGTSGGGVTRIETAAGPITVSAAYAAKFEGFFRDLVASGYHPRSIGCYARGGHIRGSLHYRGEACDVDQRARNRTSARMYSVADIAAKWGLRDGCVFGDCGHIDTGNELGGRHHARRHRVQYARLR